ncbi:hypothetical protein U27_03340 [Candidatus Vecturithrix granuli]|uniref:DUF1468 domain-containing protein n=1 Tax=Vecturithrix granuli TaxID=1499967 RepID=A0A081BVM3_VECG1|nr:hypothetical protein U27_03340 [Candidatus Vecturithrix granuli]
MKERRTLHLGETVFTWLLLAFSFFVLVLAYRISGFSSVSSPGMFPMLAAAAMAISAALLLLNNRQAEKPDAHDLKDELWRAVKDIFRPEILVYSGIIVLYMILIEPLHFLPSSFLFLAGSMIYLKGSTPVKALLISTGTLGGIYLVFRTLFRVILP